ncbi:T-box-containing protein TBX6L-like isoform X2 [Belonocnema kinseyi]|uniref:T-box-containing protein TBX6L-like isoform X2 n=1 Tax=Belonocnema kinseyi TaxID=2817044 RepID=UPI00143CF350|nr:T-box-containing protein TBX6L-like isoform X2 [Belonocnema kinseyi]
MNLVPPMNWHHSIFNQQDMRLYHRPDFSRQHFWSQQSSLGAGPRLPEEVKVTLENKKLWKEFHGETTEMIITKMGRRMFPSMQISVSGLQKRAHYRVVLEVAPVTDRRHKYVIDGGAESGNGKTSSRGWTTAGPAEPQPPQNRRIYLHPEGPATGAHWMQHPINFSKLKLTNNAVEQHTNIVLTSMHKYVPIVWIVRCDDHEDISNLYMQPSKAFQFEETEFIAVTAYQNEKITKLKIDHNPFAKGFRETGQSRCKRKFHRMMSEDQTLDLSQDYHDEEGNVSSSDSESHRVYESSEHQVQRVKRSLSENGSIDDSGVSSSGGISPPLPTYNFPESNSRVSPPLEHHPSPQPRLYRPWADSPSPSSSPSPSRTQEPALPTLSPLHYQFLYPLLAPQQHLAAWELSRIQQVQRYQTNVLFNKFYR